MNYVKKINLMTVSVQVHQLLQSGLEEY